METTFVYITVFCLIYMYKHIFSITIKISLFILGSELNSTDLSSLMGEKTFSRIYILYMLFADDVTWSVFNS